MILLRKGSSLSVCCLKCIRLPRASNLLASSPISTSVVRFEGNPNSSRIKNKKEYRYFKEENVANESDLDLPVQFTPTGVHKIRPTFYTPEVDRPRSQNLAFALSLFMIIVYFFIMREENDIDDAIRGLESQSLYEKIEGLEKLDLINYKRFLENRGMSTKEVDQRLRELDEIEMAKTVQK